jgi:FkbM family methyltransferase
MALGGPWEPLETAAVRAALRPGDGVLDVGANVGHYTLVAASAVGPRGHVWAFEPAPRPFAALTANVRLNGLRNVILEQVACGEHDGAATLHLDAANAGGHSLAADNVERPGGAVPLLRLDTWLARTPSAAPVRLLKTDAQGAELAVLRGAEGLLRSRRPTLLLEFWPYGLRRCGADADALLRLLVAHGYALEVLHEPSGARYPATPERLPVEFPAHVAWAFTTLLAKMPTDDGGP